MAVATDWGNRVVSYRGRWIVSVIGKDSDWPQRVVISGATVGGGVLSGVVGQSRLVDGDSWDLTIEHNDGSGWAANEAVTPDPMAESGVDLSQVVRSKDVFRPGDVDPNDLVVRVDKSGPAFEVTARPFAADAGTLTMLANGVFVNLNGPQLMGVTVRNIWGRPWQAGEFALDVSPLGRATLATFGATVVDAWPPQILAATQQQLLGRTVVLPALEVGESHLLFFMLDTAAAHRGKPDVEFILISSAAAPDPTNPKRYARRQVYLAEVGYDPATGTASVRIPGGTLTLRMQSMLVDERALTEVCVDVRDRLASGAFPGSRGLLDQIRAGRVMSACAGSCSTSCAGACAIALTALAGAALAAAGPGYAVPRGSGCRDASSTESRSTVGSKASMDHSPSTIRGGR